jgi:hypothetical protein
MWAKLKKYAHEIWDMSLDHDQVSAVRKRRDTAKVPDVINVGDIVSVVLGGREVSAAVLDIEDGKLALMAGDDYIDDIPQEWVKHAAPPMNQTTKIPVFDPSKEPSPGPGSEAALNLKQLLQSRGGRVAVYLSPSTVLGLVSNPDGSIKGEIFEMSTKRINSQIYPNIEHLVKALNIDNSSMDIATGFYDSKVR